MPTYSYKCRQCQAEFEIKASLAEKEKQDKDTFQCPSCHSTDISQQLRNISVLSGSSSSDSSQAPSSCPTGTCPFI